MDDTECGKTLLREQVSCMSVEDNNNNKDILEMTSFFYFVLLFFKKKPKRIDGLLCTRCWCGYCTAWYVGTAAVSICSARSICLAKKRKECSSVFPF